MIETKEIKKKKKAWLVCLYFKFSKIIILSFFLPKLKLLLSLLTSFAESFEIGEDADEREERWAALLLAEAAAAFASEPAAESAKRPAAAELGGKPAAATAAAEEDGWSPAKAAGWGIIGIAGPWVCAAEGNCWAWICCYN